MPPLNLRPRDIVYVPAFFQGRVYSAKATVVEVLFDHVFIQLNEFGRSFDRVISNVEFFLDQNNANIYIDKYRKELTSRWTRFRKDGLVKQKKYLQTVLEDGRIKMSLHDEITPTLTSVGNNMTSPPNNTSVNSDRAGPSVRSRINSEGEIEMNPNFFEDNTSGLNTQNTPKNPTAEGSTYPVRLDTSNTMTQTTSVPTQDHRESQTSNADFLGLNTPATNRPTELRDIAGRLIPDRTAYPTDLAIDYGDVMAENEEVNGTMDCSVRNTRKEGPMSMREITTAKMLPQAAFLTAALNSALNNVGELVHSGHLMTEEYAKTVIKNLIHMFQRNGRLPLHLKEYPTFRFYLVAMDKLGTERSQNECNLCREPFKNNYKALNHHYLTRHSTRNKKLCPYPGCSNQYGSHSHLDCHYNSNHDDVTSIPCSVRDNRVIFTKRTLEAYPPKLSSLPSHDYEDLNEDIFNPENEDVPLPPRKRSRVEVTKNDGKKSLETTEISKDDREKSLSNPKLKAGSKSAGPCKPKPKKVAAGKKDDKKSSLDKGSEKGKNKTRSRKNEEEGKNDNKSSRSSGGPFDSSSDDDNELLDV